MIKTQYAIYICQYSDHPTTDIPIILDRHIRLAHGWTSGTTNRRAILHYTPRARSTRATRQYRGVIVSRLFAKRHHVLGFTLRMLHGWIVLPHHPGVDCNIKDRYMCPHGCGVKSHRSTSRLFFSPEPGSAEVNILFGIMNSTTGGFLTSLCISASISCRRGLSATDITVLRKHLNLHSDKNDLRNPPGYRPV